MLASLEILYFLVIGDMKMQQENVATMMMHSCVLITQCDDEMLILICISSLVIIIGAIDYQVIDSTEDGKVRYFHDSMILY